MAESWKIIAGLLAEQSQMVAYVDAFNLILVVFLLMLPMLLIFRLNKAVVKSADRKIDEPVEAL